VAAAVRSPSRARSPPAPDRSPPPRHPSSPLPSPPGPPLPDPLRRGVRTASGKGDGCRSQGRQHPPPRGDQLRPGARAPGAGPPSPRARSGLRGRQTFCAHRAEQKGCPRGGYFSAPSRSGGIFITIAKKGPFFSKVDVESCSPVSFPPPWVVCFF